MKLILAGPPRSGKSCLRQGLKDAVRGIPGAPYPYVITACPDGEGSWFQETVNQDPDLAQTCKAAYKAKFTPEFVRRISDSVRNCTLPLTLVDIGGIPSAENREICAGATHALLLAGDDAKSGASWTERLSVWRDFCREVGLTVVAEVHSAYHGTEDEVLGASPDGIFRGSVHHLERGEPISDRPMVRALAEFLAELAARS
ncbi:hypothetical protein KKA13_00325 [Patescibacteria group bacterium]|nr:hypothetical protein [Patescibacteria group bacterium]